MLELATLTKARVQDIIVLSQKNREPEDNPGAKLTVEMDLPNRYLLELDGGLLSFLFRRDKAAHTRPQGELEGVEPVSDLPDLSSAGSKVGTLRWADEFTGYRLTVSQGLGGPSDLDFDGGTLSHLRITPKDGGTFTLKCAFEAPNVSAEAFGRLAKLKGREVEVLLACPEGDDPQTDVEQAAESPAPAPPAPRGPRKRTATEAFVDAHGIPE